MELGRMSQQPVESGERRFLGWLSLSFACAALVVFVVMPCMFVFCVPLSLLGLLGGLAGAFLNRSQRRPYRLALLGTLVSLAALVILIAIANSEPLGWRQFTD